MAACRPPIPPLGCLFSFFLSFNSFPSLGLTVFFLSFFLACGRPTAVAQPNHTSPGEDERRQSAERRKTKECYKQRSLQQSSLAQHWARDWRTKKRASLSLHLRVACEDRHHRRPAIYHMSPPPPTTLGLGPSLHPAVMPSPLLVELREKPEHPPLVQLEIYRSINLPT